MPVRWRSSATPGSVSGPAPPRFSPRSIWLSPAGDGEEAYATGEGAILISTEAAEEMARPVADAS
jgi:hypothetical protein